MQEPRDIQLAVVGGGFAGASLLRSLPPLLRGPGRAALVDRNAGHPFIPLLHEISVGRIHPESSVLRFEELCKGRARFVHEPVERVDLDKRRLLTPEGELSYRYLALAPGSRPVLPPRGMREHFRLFWTLEDALSLRLALNKAWKAAAGGAGDLSVAIVGGGTTGVELSAEIAALFDYLKKRNPGPTTVRPRITLFETEDRLMSWLHSYFHEVAIKRLARAGVDVRLCSPVTQADEESVTAGGEQIASRIRVWTAGVRPSALMEDLQTEHDHLGRVLVEEHLTLPGHPEVYALGDSASYEDPSYGPLPPTASVAVQQGAWAAGDLGRRARGGRRRPFEYFDRGYVVSLGPEDAVAEVRGRRFSGPAAQALYRAIFLYYLKNRRDRLLATADWAMERSIGRLGFG